MNQMLLIGLVRMRNESLILQDTLDHLSQYTDGLIVFDDASTDDSVPIAEKHPNVLEILRNDCWRTNRLEEETRHRQVLLDAARKYYPQWMFYSDCDERFVGPIREFLSSDEASNVAGIRVSLFDAYMTADDHGPYTASRPLLNFRRYFGPERRDILMLWQNNASVRFAGLDAREPIVSGAITTRFLCQHYGKSLSEQHWAETCHYYAEHFPEPYRSKWAARIGKAIHTKSDFGRSLYSWDEVIKHSVLIHPTRNQT
jgi:glycosyltransferase involved in cell wall biosynthesis